MVSFGQKAKRCNVLKALNEREYEMKTIGVYSFVILIMVAWVYPAQARPVSYPTGWTWMQTNDGDMNAAHLHYSPTARYSIGYKVEYWRDEEWQFHGAQFNYLIRRNNQRASQSNIYLKSGAGFAYSDHGAFNNDIEPASFIGFAYDWEDRDYFFSYENRATYAGDIAQFFKQSARVGFTPYVGDYGDLHTWLMLQVDHAPENEHPVTVTPLVRLFKGVNLVEVGMSNQGEALFNWVVRF